MGKLVELFPPTPLNFDSVRALRFGFEMITRDEFCQSLKGSIGAQRDYAENNWPGFKDNYLGYVYSRNPIKQGEALFDLAVRKSRDASTKSEVLPDECKLNHRCGACDSRVCADKGIRRAASRADCAAKMGDPGQTCSCDCHLHPHP